jgi:UDP-N-acetylglucosamine 2-epimerase
MIREFAAKHPSARLLVSLGTKRYFSMMKHASAMIGNSSSGIIEAPSFQLPVVNIGNRQRGRVRAKNVIDVVCSRHEIRAAIKKAISPEFRTSLVNLDNPYGDGHAAERIVNELKQVEFNQSLLQKRFCDRRVEAI